MGTLVTVVLTVGLIAIVLMLHNTSLRSKFHRVQDGMTHDEVAALLGEPDQVRPPLIGDPPIGKTAFWIGRNSVITIYFDNDHERVVAKYYQEADTGIVNRVLRWFGF